jgi:hypothetical protein
MKYNEGEEGSHNCYGHQAFSDTSNKLWTEKSTKVNKIVMITIQTTTHKGETEGQISYDTYT